MNKDINAVVLMTVDANLDSYTTLVPPVSNIIHHHHLTASSQSTLWQSANYHDLLMVTSDIELTQFHKSQFSFGLEDCH